MVGNKVIFQAGGPLTVVALFMPLISIMQTLS